MIASLMMYARPELAAEHRRFWALVRSELAARGIDSPQEVSNEAPEFDVWTARDLVLSQTCGMPYRTALHERVTLIGTPDYGLEHCPPGHYRSPIVVRRDDPRDALPDFATARLAYNSTDSQSGFASIYGETKRLGFWFANRLESGGHQASARMVADNSADIAALDAVTWALIQRYDGFATNLRVLGWTTPTPGLPYIAGPNADQPATFDAVRSAIAGLSEADRDALMLRDLVAIKPADYLAIANPPACAA